MARHPLEYDTLLALKANGLTPVGSRVVVGVSGGGDSLALLLVLAALRPELALALTAVYVDHGLRPGEAPAEAELVATVAAARQIPFRSGLIPVRAQAKAQGVSLEAAGRELRYRFLHQVAAEQGGALVAVAHHADDQAEELLLRLLRGAGRAGLAGMAPRNYRGVIRPFLDFPQARLRDYLRDCQCAWLEDSSNRDPRFLRNRVRLELLPLLEGRFNPAIRAGLVRTGRILAAEEELLAGLAGEFFAAVLVGPTAADHLTLEVARFRAGHPALQRRALEMALVALAAPVRFRFIEDLRQLAASRGGELHLPQGLRAVKAGGRLSLAYPAGRTRQRGNPAPLPAPPAVEIAGPGSWPLPPPLGSLRVELLAALPSQEELRSG
ncbi:MAG: tRNA lysidine(34) synthetase TilS, partial [Desulfobulbaceae bacterium]|nr:tRNA lysidine(34) synthetase TilS [Desulfobulbaceae bacterium]